jgi:hypothetical protein
MDKWIAAFTAIGGLTAFGGLIDFMMYNSEKDKLKALLEDWWLRFTYVRWSNFGRAEAELAIQLLDRWAEPRLWSWKRWRFSTVVTLLVFLLTITYTFVRLPEQYQLAMAINQSPLILPSIVTFALSLSVTRIIALLVAQLCKGRVTSVSVFIALLGLHVLLLLYWSAILFLLERQSTLIVMYFTQRLSGASGMSWSDVYFKFSDVLNELPERGLPRGWHYFFGPIRSESDLQQANLYTFKVAMDIVANGVRIFLAFVFLSSFVFRPLVQEPLSRLWYGAINSSKPTFTILFGALGAIIAAGKALAT